MEPTQLDLPIGTRPRVRLEDDQPRVHTNWEWCEPPCDGWFDVISRRDLEAGKLERIERWWFSRTRGPWLWMRNGKPPTGTIVPRSESLMHDEFIEASMAWRGLLKPMPVIYPCPPYDSTQLMERARKEGVAHMHAIITRPQRARTRL